MSFYTGRYVSSHGAQWNGYPLRVGEFTLGDHLRDAGMDCWLIGKTHMKADAEGMSRLGLAAESIIGARQAECGFDVYVRDDGLWGEGPDGFYDEKRSPYNEYLNSKGYSGSNPWADYANAGVVNGEKASGWMLNNADKAAHIREEDSETPWLTDKTIEFLKQAKDPWCAHISYIKPHWPYIVPAPYHEMYQSFQLPPASRHSCEREDPHPVYNAFMRNRIAAAFQQETVRKKVIPAYMGLIKQCDDQLGRILNQLEITNQLESTLIVLTSDHGDYLGDHWLGEKDLFHDPSVKIPLIVYDPRSAADSTRGSTCNALVEAIDLVPTFVACSGAEPADHILEGRSLLPWIHGNTPSWREYVISEYDYSVTPMRDTVGVSNKDARLFMVFDGRYKLMHAEGGFRPMLFDLESDPDEFVDLAKGSSHDAQISQLYAQLAHWGRRLSQRVTRSDAQINAMRGRSMRRGIIPFMKDGSEVPDELTARYRGPVEQVHTPAVLSDDSKKND